MFQKSHEKLDALLGSGSKFQGNVETRGTLRIDGHMEGNIIADWVIIGEKAFVHGDITARGIIIGGRLEGNIRAKEIVEIKGKGHFQGDISTSKLIISEGAIFDGKSTMHKEETNVVELVTKEKAK